MNPSSCRLSMGQRTWVGVWFSPETQNTVFTIVTKSYNMPHNIFSTAIMSPLIILLYIANTIGINEQLSDFSIETIIEKYQDHASIINIKNSHGAEGDNFSLRLVSHDEIHKLINQVDPRKATGYDQLPPKMLRIASAALTPSVTSVANMMITNAHFPQDLKLAELSPVFKKDDSLSKSKYRPLSILSCVSKIMEKVIDQQFGAYFSNILRKEISAYRQAHSTQTVLLSAVETWKAALDDKKHVGALLMDPSKAFDVIPHTLLIAKLNAYGCDENTLKLMYSYLSNRRQRTKLGTARSDWSDLSKGVPQGSVLGPALFNVFINDVYFVIEFCTMFNYADDNTITHSHNNYEIFKTRLETDATNVTEWFEDNGMQANPEKNQGIVFGNKKTDDTSFTVKGNEIEFEKHVKLLGINIDNTLKFDVHVDSVCKKASRQVNALMRLSGTLDTDIKLQMYRAFILSNFNYCPLVWMFCGQGSVKKIERLQCRALRFTFNDFTSSYEQLLENSNEPSLSISRIRLLAIEVYKCVNELAPSYLCELFEKHDIPYELRDSNKLTQKAYKTVTHGFRSFSYAGTRLWNSMPPHVKSSISLNVFKERIKAWDPCECFKF